MFAEYQSLSNVDPQTIELTRLGGGAMRIRFNAKTQPLPSLAGHVMADRMASAAVSAYALGVTAAAA